MAFAPTVPPPPAWRLTAWLTTSPGQVPPDVVNVLRGRLVVGTAPLIVAAVVGSALASLAVLRVPTPAMLAWFCADLALTLVRLASMLVMRRSLRSPAEQLGGQIPLTDLYVLSSMLWCTQIGCGVGLCMASADAVLVPFACLATTGLVGGLAARNPGAPRMTLVQMISVVLPFTTGAILSGQPWFLALCVLAPLYLVAVAAVNLRLHSDYVALLSAERALRHQALHCGLTGLPNRTFFNQALTAALMRGENEESAVALLYLDLDGFKTVNDTYGHAVGDVLLKQVASRLRDVVMTTDVVARLGGDEFAVLLTGQRAASAEMMAAAIISAVRLPYDVSQGTLVRIGVSVGISERRSHISDSHALLVNADRALYIAKKQGKGTFHRSSVVRDDGGSTTKAMAGQEAVGR